MIDATLASWLAWWDSVPPAFTFWLVLPFVVAVAGLLADALRRRRRAR